MQTLYYPYAGTDIVAPFLRYKQYQVLILSDTIPLKRATSFAKTLANNLSVLIATLGKYTLHPTNDHLRLDFECGRSILYFRHPIPDVIQQQVNAIYLGDKKQLNLNWYRMFPKLANVYTRNDDLVCMNTLQLQHGENVIAST